MHPFVKVEATKFTEVGYVGRDVDSMIRDLADIAVNMVREEHQGKVQGRAREHWQRNGFWTNSCLRRSPKLRHNPSWCLAPAL